MTNVIVTEDASKHVLSRIFSMLVLLLVAASIAGAVSAVSESIIARSLREDATTTALTWRGHFVARLGDLDQVMGHGRFTNQQRDFIEANTKIGRVFRFRLFDARGRLVFQSGEARDLPTGVALRDHDLDAVRAIQDGLPIIEIIQNRTRSELPAVYAEAHVPLLASDGEVLGLVEIHVDQSRIDSLFRQSMHGFGLSLAALIPTALLAFALMLSFRQRNVTRAPAVSGFNDGLSNEVLVEPPPVVEPMRSALANPEKFDDWLARIAEEAAQDIPERVSLECHLGLGDAVLPFDEVRMSQAVKRLVADTAISLTATDQSSKNTIVLAPRIVLTTKFTSRGVELSVADNRQGQIDRKNDILAEFCGLLQEHGGGFDIIERPGQGVIFVAWWPTFIQHAEAA